MSRFLLVPGVYHGPECWDDVRAAVDRVGDDTILVGHSLGGMLVRSLIAEREVAGAVLLDNFAHQIAWDRAP